MVNLLPHYSLFKFIIFCSIFCFLVIGCSSKETLKPIKDENRLRIKILPFDDLTGVYNKESEQFESRTSAILDSDFVQSIRFSQKYYRYELSTYPKSFWGISNNDTTDITFFIKGEVERCSYEQYFDINHRIISHDLWGIWGLYNDSDPYGFSQFRVKIYNSQKKLIDSTVIIGISGGSVQKHSRTELINRAIDQASYYFVDWLLDKYQFEFLLDKFQHVLPFRSEFLSKSQVNQIRYINLDD